jgi:tRNA splicing ligase
MDTIDIPVIDLKQDQIQSVIEQLYSIAKTSKNVRCKDFNLENGVKWTSWTMRESVYKKKDKLPTMARGIFTEKIDGKYHVAVRGYDKFFNILETGATQVKKKKNKKASLSFLISN